MCGFLCQGFGNKLIEGNFNPIFIGTDSLRKDTLLDEIDGGLIKTFFYGNTLIEGGFKPFL